jgi:hypothetical protein
MSYYDNDEGGINIAWSCLALVVWILIAIFAVAVAAGMVIEWLHLR